MWTGITRPKYDRDGFPRLRHVFADSAYAGPKLEAVLKRIGRWTLEIVKRSDTAQGLALPRQRPTPHPQIGKTLKNHNSFRAGL